MEIIKADNHRRRTVDDTGASIGSSKSSLSRTPVGHLSMKSLMTLLSASKTVRYRELIAKAILESHIRITIHIHMHIYLYNVECILYHIA